MSLIQASFKVKHECPYRTVSEQFPDITIREWYLHECQVLEISAPTTSPEDFAGELETLGTVLHESVDDEQLHAVVRSCQCSLDDSLIHRFEAHNCLYTPPTVYAQGWEHYTIVAFDEADVGALLRDLDGDRDIEVLSKTAIETQHIPHSLFVPAESLFAGLTARQFEALRIALDNGYFNQPRGASVEELAEQTSVARSTYEEHLRKAENKLITNTENLVRLVTEHDGGGGLQAGASGAVPT